MIEAHIRSKVQPIFNYFALTICLPLKLSSNAITIIAFLSGIIAALFVAHHYFLTALGLLLFSGFCDAMDGTVARISNSQKNVGAYIDLISDRLVEGALIMGLATIYPQHVLAYLFFLTALIFHFSTFVAAGALFKNEGHKSMHHEHSMIERAEAFIVFSCMLLLPHYIFEILTSFSVCIVLDGARRFLHVVRKETS